MSPRHAADPRRNLIERLSRSRDFSISLILHLLLIVLFGSTVLFESVHEPAEMVSSDPGGLVPPQAVASRPPEAPAPTPKLPEAFSPKATAPSPQDMSRLLSPSGPANLPVPSNGLSALPPAPPSPSVGQPAPNIPNGLTGQDVVAIRNFSEDWVNRKNAGTREPEYQFTAFIGQYGKGDWNSTNRVVQGKVESGSLPNLLYFMSAFSKNRVKTDYQHVRAIRLDSDELLSERPPFIFLTGTRDFELSAKEVEHLQKYLWLGGAVWGDSSVPGKNSRFDIAFRREMKKVLPDIDKTWEKLPAQHPVFSQGFFPEVRGVPAGLNSYREPIEVLKVHGQIAVLYTSNDYGNMWQVGLEKTGQIDLRRNERGGFVATDETIWNNRASYLRNLSQESLTDSYKFGTNVVIHLLGRWENLRAAAGPL